MNISQVTDYLYISTQLRRLDIEVVRELDVQLIIGMIGHIPPPRELSALPADVLWLPTQDFFLLPIPVRTLHRGVLAALPVIRQGHSVLVYCQAGRHRSVAMATAILIGMGYEAEEAMDLIVENRAVASPRTHHIYRQIKRFERYWLKKQAARASAPGDGAETAAEVARRTAPGTAEG
jgi:protein tyrosine phosphatase (PTP) superfamily phosphohydrolase (DUF442 family)